MTSAMSRSSLQGYLSHPLRERCGNCAQCEIRNQGRVYYCRLGRFRVRMNGRCNYWKRGTPTVLP